jgi:hypothetical protein
MNAKMRESAISIEGVRSPVMESGPADADEAAVFIHGNLGSIRDWESLVRGVGEFGRALAMACRALATQTNRQILITACAVTRASLAGCWLN